MYAWILSFHLIAIICWFAALFYLPRLFVYHTYALKQEDEQGARRFQLMERKLYRGIMNPSMIATVIFGVWLLVLDFQGYMAQGWIYTKLALVVVLIGYHHICLAHMKRFANGTSKRGHVYFRVFNEVPTIILIAVVILSVVKPY